jgi:membrane-bound lytic murein transglycosylase D
VRRGESLWSISQRYGVNIRSLASWNGMAPGDTLAVGRELVVWVGESASPVRAASVAAVAALGQNQTRRVNYVVRNGDSLYSIAQRFRVSVPQLLQWNDDLSTSQYIRPGDRLVMYVNVLEQST